MQLFKSLYFGVGAASRHYDLIQLSQMVQSTYFITYEFFYLLQGSTKKSYFLKVFFKSSTELVNPLNELSFTLSCTKFNRPFRLWQSRQEFSATRLYLLVF